MGRKRAGLVLAMVAMMLIMLSVSGIEDELIQLPSELEQNEGAGGRCPSGSCSSHADCGSCRCKVVSTTPFLYAKCV
ncbi:hypothetical protein SDJN03_24906, partial [Cucurbita argyrosperma subsp. sororia]